MTEFIVTAPVLEQLAYKIGGLDDNALISEYFRLTLGANSNPELVLDEPQPNDMIFHYSSLVAFVIANDLAVGFSGRTLDFNQVGDFVLM